MKLTPDYKNLEELPKLKELLTNGTGLQIAKEKNIHRVLVTCSIKNPASQAVILANGGQLEDIRHETERYWIDLE